MSLGFLEALRNSRLNAITTLIDADASAGTLKIYDGLRPATGAAITTQTLLAELTFSVTSFPAASGGSMTANAITGDSYANNPGTASWFRVQDGAGTFVFDGSVGLSGSDLNLTNLNIIAGVTVDIDPPFTLTEGNL